MGEGPPVMMCLDDFRSPELAEATHFNLRRRKMAAGGLWPAGLQSECGLGSVFLCAILFLGPAAPLGPPPSRLFP